MIVCAILIRIYLESMSRLLCAWTSARRVSSNDEDSGGEEKLAVGGYANYTLVIYSLVYQLLSNHWEFVGTMQRMCNM
jgi:hypothetical protein